MIWHQDQAVWLEWLHQRWRHSSLVPRQVDVDVGDTLLRRLASQERGVSAAFPHRHRVGTAWKSVVWLNEMMELPLPCSITSDRFCMFVFPLILQLEATKMLMFSEQTWDLFKTKDQGRGQISWSAFGRPGMFQVVWALDDRWWSLIRWLEMDNSWSLWLLLSDTEGRNRELLEQMHSLRRLESVQNWSQVTQVISIVCTASPCWRIWDQEGINRPIRIIRLKKSLPSAQISDYHVVHGWIWYDLINSGPHCWYAVYASVQRRDELRFRLWPWPVLRYLSIPMSLKRRGTHRDGSLFLVLDTFWRDLSWDFWSEPEKEQVLALKVWNSEGAISRIHIRFEESSLATSDGFANCRAPFCVRYSGIPSVQFTSINCHMRYNMEAGTFECAAILRWSFQR